MLFAAALTAFNTGAGIKYLQSAMANNQNRPKKFQIKKNS
jgi:hypothetical protein